MAKHANCTQLLVIPYAMSGFPHLYQLTVTNTDTSLLIHRAECYTIRDGGFTSRGVGRRTFGLSVFEVGDDTFVTAIPHIYAVVFTAAVTQQKTPFMSYVYRFSGLLYLTRNAAMRRNQVFNASKKH